MVAWQDMNLFSHRDENYRIEKLSASGNPSGEFSSITVGSGTIDYSIYDTIRSGGKVSAVVNPTDNDWLSARIKVWYDVVGVGSWPLGVFLPGMSDNAYGPVDVSLDVELYDKLLILTQDAYEETFTASKNAVVTDVVRAVIESTGETAVAITESDETLSSPLVFEAGENKLRIVNDLLDAAGYFSLWCDGDGVYRAEPYVKPEYRPLKFTFIDGQNCIYLPNFTKTVNTFDIPNKMICISSTDGEVEALTSVSTNQADYLIRGRWVTQVVKDVEATSQAVLDAITDRKLADAAQKLTTYEITHAWLPLNLNDIVRLVRTEQRDNFGNVTVPAVDARCTITKMEVKMSTGGLVRTTLREV